MSASSMSVCATRRFTLRARKARETGQRLRARAPARDLEAQRLQLGRGVSAHHAQSKHADLDVAGLGLLVVVLLDALALLAFVAAQLARMN